MSDTLRDLIGDLSSVVARLRRGDTDTIGEVRARLEVLDDENIARLGNAGLSLFRWLPLFVQDELRTRSPAWAELEARWG